MSLVIENLGKQFADTDENTLSGINLEIKSGEFVCIVGASGCGKSTLLNIVAGLEKATEGEVVLDGKLVDKAGADRTVMFQEHGLFPWLNVIDNVKFGMKINKASKEAQSEKAEYYLKLVGLWDYRNYLIHQLSGGMRQRVALARALTMDSKVLLMDEPFASLDKQTSNYLREELERIWLETKRTILFITHSVEEAIYLADKVVVLCPKKKGVRDIIEINLERPRNVYSKEFVELRHKVLDEVRGGR